MRIDPETDRMFHTISRSNLFRVFDYEWCELDGSFLGFLDSYKDLPDKLPTDFTVIDIGSYQAVQSEYFKDFARYIAVEPGVPSHAMCWQDNMQSYHMTGQTFIEVFLPKLMDAGLDLYKTFCVCSYVPDFPLWQELIPNIFPYYKCRYVGEKTLENYPKMIKEEQESEDD